MPSLALCLVCSLSLCSLPSCAPQEAAAQQMDAERSKVLRAAGLTAPLTVYPVKVLGRANTEVGDALALVLEHYGLRDLAVASEPFAPGDAAWDQVPVLFGAHVQAAGAETKTPRHALYAEFLGEPRRGPTEVRFVLVDGAGKVVLVDRQTPEDAAFARTAGRDPDPLGCSTLVGDRLFALVGWEKKAGSVRDGSFAELWRKKSGAPDKAERAAMEERRADLRANLAGASIAVLPTLAAGAHDGKSAERLAAQIARELGCRANAAADGAALQAPATSNEQKRLWGLASALRRALQEKAPAADYVLVADVAVGPSGRGFVHFALATRAGEIVLADFQNDQHDEFQRVQPTTVAEAEQVVLARLGKLVR